MTMMRRGAERDHPALSMGREMIRMNTQSINRRVRTLEARLVTGPSTEEKWAAIHRSALALMTKADVDLIEQAGLLRDAGREAEYTAQHNTALARWDSGCDQAFAECDVRFTVDELDEALHSK